MLPHRTIYRSGVVFSCLLLPYVMVINWLSSGKQYLGNEEVFWKLTAISLPTSIIFFGLVDILARKTRRLLQSRKHAIARGILLFLITFVIKTLFVILIFWMSARLFNSTTVDSHYHAAILVTLGISIIYAGLDEAAYAVQQWVTTLTKTEQLEKNNLHNKLRKLKEQVNPHFLFNNLNCLSSLISEDREKAGAFLNEMSGVYRYLLNNNEESLSTVEREIKFIRSYYHLQRTRYGNGIELSIDVEEELNDYRLPTLTLQLLVENAIKHNATMENKPLRIKISSVGNDALVISNNVLPRLVKPPSTRIGLSNIIQKYKILNAPDIEIDAGDHQFSVKIPLIREPV